ncbi:pyrroline-5-carboxylate reductase [uncultured Campylobacter sp.]|uniref:pyrroline-5-carboxylate reductase n=1 Tax=uncultured Campylobacter sp. TaxID=218934 RepID=UPI002624D481|nr:pyrroline-5-carboxylate reductase [uncultured Campylobacter sp.]
MKVGFIGGGNMGEAMIAALCGAGGRDCAASGENFSEYKENFAHDGRNFMPDTQSFAACGQNSANLDQNFTSRERDSACAQPASDTKLQVLAYARSKNETLRKRYGVQILQDETQLAHEADIIVLATKPASYEGILRLIAPELAGKILLLLAPNFKLECAQNIVGADVFVARAMPNVAAGIGASATALCYGEYFDEASQEIVRALAAKIGKFYEIDEAGFAAFTGIAGSLPAYVCAFIEAAADAGVRGGLPRALCYDAVAAAVEGTARLLQSGKRPSELKDAVCSPAGTTIEGLAALEAAGFRAAVMAAIEACIAKARC